MATSPEENFEKHVFSTEMSLIFVVSEWIIFGTWWKLLQQFTPNSILSVQCKILKKTVSD